MTPPNEPSAQFFDPTSDFTITERRLPHWSQPGTVCFSTWRTDDSMPSVVLDGWFCERAAWLESKGIDAYDPKWRESLFKLSTKLAREFTRTFWNRWHGALDECYGSCVLKKQRIAAEVGKSLHHFDGQRYMLFDFVVMPNPVHVLAAFHDEQSMLKQCESWKHFTAREINRLTGQKGRFWQQDSFDHLVRSEAQFEYLRRYIAENPIRAKLRNGEFLHYSKALSALNNASRGA
jgi:putative transposase